MPQIDIGDLKIHYTEKGSGDTLLIFPDHLQSSLAYTEEIDHFADRFHVLSFDYPGTGRSTHERLYPDEQEFDLWTYWADLACHLLLELDIDGCFAVGVDGGARVALHFAGKQAPAHRLATWGVVADSFLADLDSRALHRSLDLREHYYVRNASFLERQHGEDWRQVVDADTAFLRRIADRGGYQVPDFVLNAAACPVLLTGHMQDMRAPGIAHEFARISAIIPDCSIYLMSTSGHPHIEFPFMWSDPDSFRAAMDRFLDRVTRGSNNKER